MTLFRLEQGPVPLHHQVYLDLRAGLDAGEWAPGDRLPPERELADRYGCSLITVRRALSELAREQRLQRTPGRGTTVLRPPIERDFAGTMSFTDEMQTRGLDPETRVIAARAQAAGEEVAEALELDGGLADPVPRTAPRRRRRAAAAGAGLSASGALPRSTGLGSRAHLAVRPADRTLRDPDRPGPRVARAGTPPVPGGSASPTATPHSCAAHPRRCLRSRSQPGRVRPDLRTRRPNALLRRAGGGAEQIAGSEREPSLDARSLHPIGTVPGREPGPQKGSTIKRPQPDGHPSI